LAAAIRHDDPILSAVANYDSQAEMRMGEKIRLSAQKRALAWALLQ